jgi:3-phenylpropionate/trans-cinnamate dioxygenase ferredoxin subunit
MDTSAEFHRLAPVSEIPDGKMRCFEIAGKRVLVCHTKQEFYAVDGVCTHAFAQMEEGRLRGFRLICPLHGAAYDVRSGAVLGAPATVPLKTYAVRIVDDHVEVSIP